MRISDWSSDVCSSDLLDAARAGGYTLQSLLAAIKSKTGLRVQTGGGVRKRSDVERLLAAGADRVVVGSIAVEMAAWVAAWVDDSARECRAVGRGVRQIGRGLGWGRGCQVGEFTVG